MGVNAKHAMYDQMAGRWERCRDVYNGQDAIHGKGIVYLPKLKEQTDADYNAYVSRATFYNATYRTITGLLGMVFRQPPMVVVPESIEGMMNDVTLSGVPLQAFTQTITEEALKLGRVGVLVDYPSVNVEGTTQADARNMNLRPTMQMYEALSIINWRTATINNKTVLVLVVLAECAAEIDPDGFGQKLKDVWRVLDIFNSQYRVRLFERKDDKDIQIGKDIFPIMGGKPLDFIPFAFISADDITPQVDEPPLIDLVNLNVSHYRSTADLEHGAHFTGLPTPYISGYSPEKEGEKFYIGSATAWIFPNADAKAGYLEFTGQGLDALEKVINRKEQQMAILGARMLEPQKAGVETAESQSIHRKGEESMLASVAQTISMGLEVALMWFAEWAGADPEGVEFELNKDFSSVPMSSQQLTALISAWQQGGISKETLFENLQQAEIISKYRTFEEEEAKIGDEPPATAKANAAAEASAAIAAASGFLENPTKAAAAV